MVLTEGIRPLPAAAQSAICEKVESFNTFTDADHPCEENDLGSFDHNGEASSGTSTLALRP